MGSLKEIKSRIQSVKSTQKITSAMKMVSSAKLRKAEKTVNGFLPYQQGMNDILTNFLSAEIEELSEFSLIRDVNKVAIVVFASNSSLCGSYNANLIKRMQQSINTHKVLRKEDIVVFPVGKKVAQACSKLDINIDGNYEELANAPTFELAETLANKLMTMYLNHEIDRVKIIYFHYASKSSQKLTADTYLPIELNYSKLSANTDYIIEPNRKTVMDNLIPMVLRLRIYAAALDANASEHAARTIAMQIATENADDILKNLSLEYNKSRQQAITNELLDIVGGSFK